MIEVTPQIVYDYADAEVNRDKTWNLVATQGTLFTAVVRAIVDNPGAVFFQYSTWWMGGQTYRVPIWYQTMVGSFLRASNDNTHVYATGSQIAEYMLSNGLVLLEGQEQPSGPHEPTGPIIEVEENSE